MDRMLNAEPMSYGEEEDPDVVERRHAGGRDARSESRRRRRGRMVWRSSASSTPSAESRRGGHVRRRTEVENLRRQQLAFMEGERSASSWKGKRGQDKKRKGLDKDDVEAMRIHLSKEAVRKAREFVPKTTTAVTQQQPQLQLTNAPSTNAVVLAPSASSAEREATDYRFGFFGGPCSSAGTPGVGEDAREVEGPVEASSLAHARQQGLPGVGEQDAREVGGYDDDEADYGDNDSEASQGPASDTECWLGDPSDLNDPRWAQMSVAAKFGLGKKGHA